MVLVREVDRFVRNMTIMAAKKVGKDAKCFNMANLKEALKKGMDNVIARIKAALDSKKRLAQQVVAWLKERKEKHPAVSDLLLQL